MKRILIKKLTITLFLTLSGVVQANIPYDLFTSLNEEEKAMYKNASKMAWESIRANLDDCDYSTFRIKVRCLSRRWAGYCTNSKLVRNLDNEVIGSVGCGYNNTDRLYDLFIDLSTGSVRIEELNLSNFRDEQVCWECTDDGEVCWAVPCE